jgi:hypothetical protein
MHKSIFISSLHLAIVGILGFPLISQLHAHAYEHDHDWIKPTAEKIGDGHGEIAVAANGEVYLSVGTGEKAGIQVYAADGEYLRNVTNAPDDFHGFVIVKEAEEEFIYGARLKMGEILKMTLAGEVVLKIPTYGTPVEKFFRKHRKTGKSLGARLTSEDALPNGDIFVVDGYGNDHIFRFNQKGEYLGEFGGRMKAPLKLMNCHKIFIDHRYGEPRLLLCDRLNNRLVHTTLEGELIKVYATKLRKPSSAALNKDLVAIAEIDGRISVFNKQGEMVAEVGTNNTKDIGKNTFGPETWINGIVKAPHGIAFDAMGDILMTEYNQWGRVMKFQLKK